VLEVLTRKVLTQLQTSVQQCLLAFANTPAFADAQSLPVPAQFTDECVASLHSLADTGAVAKLSMYPPLHLVMAFKNLSFYE
jgi:hypothetical protein